MKTRLIPNFFSTVHLIERDSERQKDRDPARYSCVIINAGNPLVTVGMDDGGLTLILIPYKTCQDNEHIAHTEFQLSKIVEISSQN